jgi:hypothetical protein
LRSEHADGFRRASNSSPLIAHVDPAAIAAE